MKRLILDATTKSITAVLSGAAATTNPDFTAHYADATSTTFTEGENDGALNGATPVTIVASPAASTQRIIAEITIQNRDTAAVVLTLRYVSAGGTRQLWSGTLSVGDTFTFDGVLDANGDIKTTLTPHNLLSATHSDTLTAAVTRGALVVGNATPKWSALALGTVGKIPISDGTDLVYRVLADADIPDILSVTKISNLTSNGIVTTSGSDGTLSVLADPLIATRGGTGLSSFAVGDLLYADTTTTIGKLADVAVNQVLVSGGVGVAPAWSATPTLQSLTLSHTAPTFVMTDTTASAKSLTVLTDANVTSFYESAGAAGDILSLDLVNKRVGIGMTGPGTRLEVSDSNASATANQLTITNTNTGAGTYSAGIIFGRWSGSVQIQNARIYSTGDSDSWGNQRLTFQTTAGTSALVDTLSLKNDNVGIGTTVFGTSAAKVLAIGNGTEPSTGPADTIQLYSIDDTAGNTILGIFAEGTGILATGQADSVSSVRVKVRINGTTVTLLGI